LDHQEHFACPWEIILIEVFIFNSHYSHIPYARRISFILKMQKSIISGLMKPFYINENGRTCKNQDENSFIYPKVCPFI